MNFNNLVTPVADQFPAVRRAFQCYVGGTSQFA